MKSPGRFRPGFLFFKDLRQNADFGRKFVFPDIENAEHLRYNSTNPF